MKKTLITVALIACAAFAYLPSAQNLPCSGFQFTNTLASPVLWDLWDAVLAQILAHMVGDASHLPASPESVCDSLAPLVVAAVLGKALEDTQDVEPQNSIRAVSISPCLVRRIVERELTTVRERSAKYRRGQQNRG
jgi:hypothetical protein